MKQALIAMSGGVDSAVAAFLMKEQGYDCTGVTLKLFDQGSNEDLRGHSCCSLADVEDARRVAWKIGIPHYVYNFKDDFGEKVINRFIREYEQGRTPNPCIDCNRYIKFQRLLARADEMGADLIATGHYARVDFDEKAGLYRLKKGLDPLKDQSYVLYYITQSQLARIRFPVGERRKEEVREIAQNIGFTVANKPDSQDICFVPDRDYARFIEEKTGNRMPDGDFIDLDGNLIGRHAGLTRYTIGQRRGLRLSAGYPLYVVKKDRLTNTVTLGPDSALFARQLIADDLNWIDGKEPPGRRRVEAKIRYSHHSSPAWAEMVEGSLKVTFDSRQRAITPGQAVVLYEGDNVLGGGTIRSVLDPLY